MNNSDKVKAKVEADFEPTVVESVCKLFETPHTPRNYEEWRSAKIKSRAKYDIN